MNVAIIGCGGMGGNHAAMAANCGLKIAVCADPVRPAAAALAKRYGAKIETDCVRALQRDDVDIVAITTPTPTHAGFVKAAAAAGKHIFCEKPFCRTVKECREAIAAAKKARVKLFIGHVVRYFHEFEAMRKQIASGKIGDVGFVKLYRGGLYPIGMKKWFRSYEQSGGVTFDCMIHDLDWIRYVFGEPDHLFCQTLMRTKPHIMDYSQVTLRMKNGMLATVIGTWAHPGGFRVAAEICGSDGIIQFDSAESSISAMKRETGKAPGMIVPSSAEVVSPYQLEWEDFLGDIAGKHKPRVTPEDALRAVEIADAALKSAKTKRPVTL